MAYNPFPNIGGIDAAEFDPLLNDAYKNYRRSDWRDAVLRSARGANLGDFLNSVGAGSENVVQNRYALADALAQLEDLLGIARGTSSATGPTIFQRQQEKLNQIMGGQLPGVQGNFAQELLNALGDDPNTPQVDYKNSDLVTALGSQAGQQAVFDALAARAGMGTSGFGRMGVNARLKDIQDKSFGSEDRFDWLRRLANEKSLFGDALPTQTGWTQGTIGPDTFKLGDPARPKPPIDYGVPQGEDFNVPFGMGKKPQYPIEDEAMNKIWAGSY